MSQLAEIIRVNALGNTAADVAAALESSVVSRYDKTSYSLSGVLQNLALIDADPDIDWTVDQGALVAGRAIIRTLPVGGDTLEGLLLTGGGEAGGVDFTLPAIRYQLQLNIAHPDSTEFHRQFSAGMLLIGIQERPQWKHLGLASLPSVEEIEAALNEPEPQPPAYNRHNILLSFNRTGASDLLFLRVQEAVEDGQTGNVVKTISLADPSVDLPDNERSFVDAILAAIDGFVETLA